jgi:hypothetical protein
MSSEVDQMPCIRTGNALNQMSRKRTLMRLPIYAFDGLLLRIIRRIQSHTLIMMFSGYFSSVQIVVSSGFDRSRYGAESYPNGYK